MISSPAKNNSTDESYSTTPYLLSWELPIVFVRAAPSRCPRLRLHSMCHAPCNNCPCWCVACICPCCTSWYMRGEALKEFGGWNAYRCCQGECAQCTSCCSSCEESCPKCTMCCEAYCCLGLSITATKNWVQMKHGEMIPISVAASHLFDCVSPPHFALVRIGE
jgi:hypothetical protein